MPVTNRVVRLKEVIGKIGLSRSTIYAMMKDGRFPPSVKLYVRSVGWREHDIDAWIDARVNSLDDHQEVPLKKSDFIKTKYVHNSLETAL